MFARSMSRTQRYKQSKSLVNAALQRSLNAFHLAAIPTCTCWSNVHNGLVMKLVRQLSLEHAVIRRSRLGLQSTGRTRRDAEAIPGCQRRHQVSVFSQAASAGACRRLHVLCRYLYYETCEAIMRGIPPPAKSPLLDPTCPLQDLNASVRGYVLSFGFQSDHVILECRNYETFVGLPFRPTIGS